MADAMLRPVQVSCCAACMAPAQHQALEACICHALQGSAMQVLHGNRVLRRELLRVQVEVAAEVHEGAPSQCSTVLGRLLAGLLTDASDLLLDSLGGGSI